MESWNRLLRRRRLHVDNWSHSRIQNKSLQMIFRSIPSPSLHIKLSTSYEALSGTLSSAPAPLNSAFCASPLLCVENPGSLAPSSTVVLPSNPPFPVVPASCNSELVWPEPGCPRPVCTSADVAPCNESEAAGFTAEASMVSGLGVNVRSLGAVPAGRVWAENSGAASFSETILPT